MARRGASNDKYLRLTGLWPSKSNDKLLTGRVKAEDVESIIKKCEEAVEAGAPMVFSLWENDKKESKRDPEFSLQCFVGEAEEQPRSNRSSRSSRDEDEAPRKKRPADDDDDDEAPKKRKPADDEEDEAPKKKRKPAEEEEDEAPKKKARKESW